MRDTLDGLKAFCSGMKIAVLWSIMNIKRQERLYMKLIYIIIFILEIILVPVKLLIIPILMLISKTFRETISEISDDMEYDLEESER